MKNHKIYIDTSKCIGCELCIKNCVAHNIKKHEDKAEIILNDCVMCGQCAAICPKKAIKISGYDEEQIEKLQDVHLDPNTILDVIRYRRTIRQFKQDRISKEVIDQILEAGRLTHTAKNSQDVSYIVLDKEKDQIEKLAVNLFKKVKPFADMLSPIAKNNKINDHFFFFDAPLVILVLAKSSTNGLLAAQNMEFISEAHGLGVLYSGYFTMAANMSSRIKKALKLPKGKKVAMTLVLGYPNVKFLRSTQHEKIDVRYM
ncbi:nitroreductase family protein [Anaerorhabdus sp.]|uniref:nitroreductase family protein n=1 Tax=Anaerorhabdus sp. TaxID=1872524 RepID=UPI002FC59245